MESNSDAFLKINPEGVVMIFFNLIEQFSKGEEPLKGETSDGVVKQHFFKEELGETPRSRLLDKSKVALFLLCQDQTC